MKGNQFKQEPPGLRFLNLYARLHVGRKGIALATASILLGLAMIVLGLWPGLVPTALKVILTLAGLGLVMAQFQKVARWCDIVEVAVREIVRVSFHHRR